MNIDNAIRLFSDFLTASWENVIPLLLDRPYTTNESSINDWLQVNWEFLVERKVLPINKYLEIYGEGADFYGESSRITDIHSLPNYSIKVVLCYNNQTDVLNNINVYSNNFIFEKLVGFENGFYIDNPPFNHVLVHDINIDIDRVFSIDKVKFELQLLPMQ